MGMPAKTPPAPEPEYIQLPDGRRFRVTDLLRPPKDKISYNLRTRLMYGARGRGRSGKIPPRVL